MIEEVLQLAFRWTHVAAAVAWVGLLQALAWALPRSPGSQPGHQLGHDLGQRLATWLRLAAGLAWLAGLALLVLLYDSGRYPYFLEGGFRGGDPAAGGPRVSDWLPALVATLVGAGLYELALGLGERGAARLRGAAAALAPWTVLAAALATAAWLEHQGVSRRAMYVHAGALVATAVLSVTFGRIAPALARGELPRRSLEHAARLSLPVVLLMLGVDQPGLLGHDPWPLAMGSVLVAGWVAGGWIGRARDDG